MKRSVKLILTLVAALAMLLAACGDGDDTEATDEDAAEEAASDDGAAEEEGDAEEDDAMEEDAAAEEEGGDDEGDAMAGDGTNVGLTFDIGGRGDQSFNDSAAVGIDAAKAELGIEFSEAEPNTDGSNRAELLQLQADQSELVLAIGFLFEGDVVAAAGDNPDVNFAVVDSAMLDFEAEGGPAPYADNVAGLTFAEEQGSFLVGAAAALKSESGTVGFIGGVGGFGLIEKFEAGFTAGAQAVNPDITVIPQYITMAPDFDGFFAADRAKEIALTMYGQGADVVYHAAGGSGAGLFEAAKEQSESSGTKVWAIGVDSDQYNTSSEEVREYILTSMLKRVDIAVQEVTRAHVSGNFAPGNTVYDLKADGVGYSTTGGFVDDIVPELEDFKAQIIAGDIVVPTEP